jgi:phage terminase large subunit
MLGTLTTQQPKRIKPIAPFTALPWQVRPWHDKSPVVLLTGGAGGGKSRLAMEKVHAYCLKYPGATGVIARKVRASMASGTVLFVRRKVVGNDPNVRFIDSPKLYFEYRNGSILAFVGLQNEDARENLKSIGQDGAVDIAVLEEGTQFEEDDFNAMLARMRGKAAPWRQIIIPTNPDAPGHWINMRLIVGGQAAVYYSNAKDNFHNPADYEQWLNSLTGVDYERFVLGKWVQASGLVYDTWSDRWDNRTQYVNLDEYPGNVTEAAEYQPDGGSVFWAVDDGYVGKRDAATGLYTADSHPRVFLLIQERPDGRLCVFAESYAVYTMEDDHISQVLELGYPEPEYAVVDKSAASLKGHLHHTAGVLTVNGPAVVDESIKVLRGMLAPDSNDYRRILVHPRCKQLRAEMASYRYDQDNGKPVKQFDHGCDALRYFSAVMRMR